MAAGGHTPSENSRHSVAIVAGRTWLNPLIDQGGHPPHKGWPPCALRLVPDWRRLAARSRPLHPDSGGQLVQVGCGLAKFTANGGQISLDYLRVCHLCLTVPAILEHQRSVCVNAKHGS